MREILTPVRCKLACLLSGVERLEDLMRRYGARSCTSGAPNVIAEDIRQAALESSLPSDLEKHVPLNRAGLNAYERMRAEVMYAGARLVCSSGGDGSKGK